MGLGNGGPIGGYVPADTALHRVDPRVKVVLLFVWTAALFAMSSWLALAIVAVIVFVLAVGSDIGLNRMGRSLAPVAFILVIILVANSLRFDGSAAWPVVGEVGISPEGLEGGAKVVARIVLMVMLTLLVTATTSSTELMEAFLSLMGPLRRLRVPVDDIATMLSIALRFIPLCGLVTATTSSTELMEAFLSLMGPLRRLRVPVDDIATMLSIALRFIPLCGAQLDRVVMAQRARGARVGQGGPIARVTSWVPVMIPLFVGLFRRSDALSAAMAARCYQGKGRTCLTTCRVRPVDVAVLVAGLLSAVGLALVG